MMRCVTASGVALLLLFLCGGGEALTPTTHKGNNHNDDEDVLDKIHSGVADAEESELEANCNRREDRYLRAQLARVKSLPPPIPMTQQQIKTEQRERELMEAASTFMRPLNIPQMQ
ncbi:unnamed protein product [Vitrella brassicaformis CCMP3155]|uniref:Secreted protein n=1 Tax=Vitrella brassicaformis (strain CCMP3155) TaxID=1169540 RepID=A0A0G4ETW9_VITBC|nr:unnamed protein product [Vitrella brassicaformis CCMP3155]|eukprot:CEM01508.1 unnamed protein product [Vitrella brassicaformis CCMP3155]